MHNLMCVSKQFSVLQFNSAEKCNTTPDELCELSKLVFELMDNLAN